MNIQVHIDQTETGPPVILRLVFSFNGHSVESVLAYFFVFVYHLLHRHMAASAFGIFFKHQSFA